MLLIVLVVALAVWWGLLRVRLLPTSVMQAWFFVVNMPIILCLCALTALFPPLQKLGVRRYYTERVCVVVLTVGFIAVRILNPQIRMFVKFDANDPTGRPKGWHHVPEHGTAVVSNHVSFWDVYAFFMLYPLRKMPSMRTLLKASLLDIPLFGPAMRRIGQFPVYFKSDADGHFQVDKDRQAVVQKEVDRHINEGGSIIFYPEGALNRTPRQLQPFRFGTFHSIIAHRMRVYYLVLVGNEETWARKSMVGGRPADICARVGFFPIDYAVDDAKSASQRMQTCMQKVYDEAALDLESVKAGKVPLGFKEV